MTTHVTALASTPAAAPSGDAAPTLPPGAMHTWPQVSALREAGAVFWQRGWSLGTSSNYSVLVSREPHRLLITSSGKDKGRLGEHDFVLTDENARAVEPPSAVPSAEALLHATLTRRPEVGAVLHTHSVWATLLSDQFAAQGGFEIEGYEMLKGLSGVRTHEHREWVTIFENTQDMRALAQELLRRIDDPVSPVRHGFLLRRHGLYTWGRDLDEARRHIEIFEFLFEVVGRRLGAAPG